MARRTPEKLFAEFAKLSSEDQTKFREMLEHPPAAATEPAPKRPGPSVRIQAGPIYSTKDSGL